MSRRNYIHTMDALIGKPYYSNAAGAVLDPNTGLEAPTDAFIPQEMPTNEYTTAIPPIAVAVTEAGDLQNITIEKERRDAEALRLANLSEVEKAQRLQRIELMKVQKAQRDAKKIAEAQANLVVVPVPYSAPPLIIGGGGGFGGGGSDMSEPSKPSAPIVAKPSFLKKNFVPLLLVAGAIYVFIKNPIK